MNQKGFLNIILIVVIVGIIAIGGYFVLSKKSLPTSQQPTPTPKDETANWKTYTNAQYGFEFKYPPNLNDVYDKNFLFNIQSMQKEDLKSFDYKNPPQGYKIYLTAGLDQKDLNKYYDNNPEFKKVSVNLTGIKAFRYESLEYEKQGWYGSSVAIENPKFPTKYIRPTD